MQEMGSFLFIYLKNRFALGGAAPQTPMVLRVPKSQSVGAPRLKKVEKPCAKAWGDLFFSRGVCISIRRSAICPLYVVYKLFGTYTSHYIGIFSFGIIGILQIHSFKQFTDTVVTAAALHLVHHSII